MTFLELAKKVVQEENRPLTSDEIWRLATTKGYDKLLKSKGKTPDYTLAAVIYSDAKSGSNSTFVTIGARPKKFFLRELTSEEVLKQFEKQVTTSTPVSRAADYDESDLHSFLTYFAKLYQQAFTKTISHLKSEKKQFGEWVHPDMVGCHFPIEDWKPEVVDFGAVIGNIAIRLFSYEIKKELSFSNLREAFFQTVSNSSWANEGYLVAAEISSDDDFRAELRRLAGSFGIGVIKIDIDDPDSSEILFPARPRENLDWDTVNKLTAMNADFKGFLKRIKIDIQSKEIRAEQYEKILQPDELVRIIKKKQREKQS